MGAGSRLLAASCAVVAAMASEDIAMASEDICTSPNVTLSNGVVMPRVGYGCAGRATAASVEAALRAGARLLDTAQAAEWYDEAAVAEGLARSGVPRSDVVIVTKLHPRDHGANSAAAKIAASAALFGGYVDVFLQHYPSCWDGLCGTGWQKRVEGDWRDSWRAMEAAYAAGAVKAVGASNFRDAEFRELLQFATVKPHVFQTWMDPFHAEKPLRAAADRAGVVFMSYSTLGTQWEMQRRGNPVLASPTLRAIGAPSGASAAAVALSWAVQRGAVVIPRSSSPAHVAANARTYVGGALQLCLSAADLARVDALDGTTEPPPADAPVAASFANLGDEAVELFWRSPGGAETKVGLLEPRGSTDISTFAGHVFVARLRRSPGAAPLAVLEVAARPGGTQAFAIADPEEEEL